MGVHWEVLGWPLKSKRRLWDTLERPWDPFVDPWSSLGIISGPLVGSGNHQKPLAFFVFPRTGAPMNIS